MRTIALQLLIAVLLCATCGCLAASTDYYKTLNVRKDASLAQIKSAYRKLSKKYHPDRNKAQEAEEKFLQISKAYEILSEEELRTIYDQHGEEGVKRHQAGHSAGGNPMDIFSQFFGGGRQQQQERKTPNMVSEVLVDLQDVYVGKTFDFEISAKRLCEHCGGSGAQKPSDIVECGTCHGSGVVLVRQQLAPGMFTQMQAHCNKCGGRGKHIKKVCKTCHGQRLIQSPVSLSLSIDRGLPEDSEIVFENEADEHPDYVAGDVVVRVRTKQESGGWSRKGPNLYWKEVISVQEALFGFERKIESLDGHYLTLRREGVTQPGFVQTIKEEGLPHYHDSGHGNLYVTYQVVLPTKLDPKMKSKLQTAFGYSSKQPADIHLDL